MLVKEVTACVPILLMCIKKKFNKMSDTRGGGESLGFPYSLGSESKDVSVWGGQGLIAAVSLDHDAHHHN